MHETTPSCPFGASSLHRTQDTRQEHARGHPAQRATAVLRMTEQNGEDKNRKKGMNGSVPPSTPGVDAAAIRIAVKAATACGGERIEEHIMKDKHPRHATRLRCSTHPRRRKATGQSEGARVSL